NCYGLIGANGAGKSTLLRCLSGEEDRYSGNVIIPRGLRMSVLKQDHFGFNDVAALTAVIMGHERLHQVMVEKEAIYAKPDFNDEDGMKAAELESDFADMNGYTAEADAATLLSGLGIPEARHQKLVGELDDDEKVRVLLAQAIFGSPDILLLDEPTNHLDTDSILWLENFLLDFKATTIVVSHDRHFLDKVCTHVADVDFGTVKMFVGNYTFWYESSKLALEQKRQANKKAADKVKELKAFIQRFSANASKSRQASSRRALLDKITLDDLRPSNRKYPYIVWKTDRPLGKQVLTVDRISKTIDGEVMFKDLTFTLGRGESIAVTGSDTATACLMEILAGEMEPDEGEIHWGVKVNRAYFPKDNSRYFDTDDNLVSWMRQFSPNAEEEFLRSFLGRMLFKGDETQKSARVLSGGEKVRCMLARMMLQDPNFLILDGPTNHLDLETITALNNSLLEFDGSMILASHDVQFVDSLVSRVLELDGEDFYDIGGSYEDYLADEARQARAHARQEAKKHQARQ
ncbi:MAG: ATP-binding cassette domain-containing protein, partial [Myxococcales bacterium]|nr:ATP-binding cassette domain-containing protein [Myxococcales bacterium]